MTGLASTSSAPQGLTVLRLQPLQYAHIINENTNVVTLLVGPLNRTLSLDESLTVQPTAFHVVPPDSYCRILNPHDRAFNAATGVEEPVMDVHGQVTCRMGEVQYRYHVPPFPLYPDEELVELAPLEVLMADRALLIQVVQAYVDSESGVARHAGERYLIHGPGTYYPRVEECIEERRPVLTVLHNHGVHCRAIASFTDADNDGTTWNVGDEYLYMKAGSFVARPWEVAVRIVEPIVLGKDQAVHVEVREGYTDARDFAKGIVRRAGDVFMVTGDDCYAFLPHPYDIIQQTVKRIVVSDREYCVVRNAVTDSGFQTLGARRVYTNTNFFLRPGEELEEGQGPHREYVLTADQALLLVALEDFTEDSSGTAAPVHRRRGDQWLVRGPCRLLPTCHVKVVPDSKSGRDIRECVLLSEGEGLYVRETATGVVRLIVGPTSYMVEACEEIWEKPLPPHVEKHLGAQLMSHAAYMQRHKEAGERLGKRDMGVVYHIPHRSVTQLYNYRTQATRTVFGPDRILLEPDEGFTVVSLSGSPWDPENPTKCLPKQPGHLTALYLFLGPSNMSDVVHVETRDHAQLALQLCYDWYFDIPYGDAEAASRCFVVNDFVGDACSYIASRIRSAVASLPFENFHRNSARHLKEAVFGIDPATGRAAEVLRFPRNGLVITSVDTQELEVLDARTRRGLQKSVKMAIEITTHSQEAHAQQVATARAQEASGLLDRQRMKDQVDSEEQRRILLETESKVLSIVNSGKSTAAAAAAARSIDIESTATVEAAIIRAEREALSYRTISDTQHKRNELLLQHQEKMAALASAHQQAVEEVNYTVMESVVAALGPETIAAVAKAGPELQAKLLSSLGLEGFLVTDGSTPINLFRTAAGLTASSCPATHVPPSNTAAVVSPLPTV